MVRIKAFHQNPANLHCSLGNRLLKSQGTKEDLLSQSPEAATQRTKALYKLWERRGRGWYLAGMEHTGRLRGLICQWIRFHIYNQRRSTASEHRPTFFPPKPRYKGGGRKRQILCKRRALGRARHLCWSLGRFSLGTQASTRSQGGAQTLKELESQVTDQEWVGILW